MNKNEERYAAHLNDLLYAKTILGWQYETVQFTLAHNEPGRRNATTYTPDFLVVTENALCFYDVKPFWKKQGRPHYEGDAKVKMKLAAEKFPWVRFFGVWLTPNGVWEREEF